MQMLKSLQPDFDWEEIKFTHDGTPHGFWNEASNQRRLFDQIGAKLGVREVLRLKFASEY